ncbi:hypothetical protein Hanom_Chr10g00913031 [Helianthus anomalus]
MLIFIKSYLFGSRWIRVLSYGIQNLLKLVNIRKVTRKGIGQVTVSAIAIFATNTAGNHNAGIPRPPPSVWVTNRM